MALYVSKTGVDNVAVFGTISEAVAAAGANETIIVRDGVYVEDVVIGKSITLLSENGQWDEAAGTGVKIVGIAGSPTLGTVQVTPGTSGVTIGDLGKGFTIIGKDGVPAIENSAVYLQGNVSNITIRGNDIVANGDGALTSEFGATVTNVTIDNNIFSGKTFNGSTPAGEGSSQQFTLLDVPRQLVVMGGAATSNVTFTNNQITGTAGGINSAGREQGNSLVTLDVVNSLIDGNTFTGFTNYGGYALRVRRDGTSITNNTFDSTTSGSDNTSQVLVQTANPGMSSGNDFIGGAGNDIIYATAGAGGDSYDGAGGVDTFSFSPAATTGAVADLQSGFAFSGTTGYDTLVNIENLVGTSGNDSFFGDAGANTFFATTGTDSVNGRGGNDTIDTSSFSANTSVNLSTGSASGFGGTTSLSGIENATTGAGNDTLVGTSAANVLVGNGGNDTFTGNGGGDTIVGGAGLDTVIYGAVDADDFSLDALTWSVATGTGTDTLSGVEVVNTSGGKILLVGNGGYATIQEAINAAADGDTVLIAEGTYTGDLSIIDKAISLVGVGEVSIIGGITVDDDFVADDVLTFKNISIDATGEQYGIKAIVDSVTNAGKIVLDGVHIENARQGGFFYENSLNSGSNPQSLATIGAVEIINGSSFYNNGYIHTGAGGRAHVHLFGFNGDLTVDDVTFDTATGLPESGQINVDAVQTQKAIVINGVREGGTAGVGPYHDAGDLTLNNVTINGEYSQDVLVVYNVKEFASVNITDVTIEARGPWGLVNFDGVGGEVDLSGIEGTNSFVPAPGATAQIGVLQGLASDDELTGTDGSDTLLGRGGADILEGGAGNDTLIGGNITGPSNARVIGDDANSVVDTAVLDADAILSWNGTNWVATSSTGVDTLYGIEKVKVGSDVYLLVDKAANGGFSTIQSAIDFASGGETILIAAGDYSEYASNGGNPVGLLINKSVTLQGVDAGGLITDAADVVAKIMPSVQSGWGTQVFVTADNVSIIGLEIEALSSVAINKIVEIIGDNFTLSGSKVGAADGADIGSAIYVNDGNATSDPGFISAIETLTIDGNVLEGDIAITNGAGIGHANPQLNITDNEFVLNEGADEFWNWGIIITGQDTAVAWRLADVAIPNVSGNTFSQGYTGDRILFVRGDNTAALVDAADLNGFLSLNDTGTYAYVTAPNGDLRYIPTGSTQGFAVHRFAGNASADALAGDTLVVSSGSNNDTQIITVDDLTVVALEGSTDLNVELGAGVETVTIGDYAPGEGEDVMVTGNAGDNSITGNSGDNVITGGAGADDLFGGAGNDTFLYDSAADFAAGETVDGGSNAAGIDTIEFRASANETLTLSSGVTGIEAVIVNADAGINAGIDASAVGSGLAFFGDAGNNTFTGTGFTDSFNGAGGIDTVIENGTGTVVLDGGQWGIDNDNNGSADQNLNDIEIVDLGGAGGVKTLLVGNGGFATIQEAINAAGVGDTVLIAAGTYTEKLSISTNGLTLKALGEVNIAGTFNSDNGITGSTADFFQTAPGYNGAAGSGITVSAANVTLDGLNVGSFVYGINLGEGTSNLTLNNVDVTDTVSGIHKPTSADVAGVTINGGSFTDSYQGIVLNKANDANDGFATGININGTHFQHLTEKGIYAETLNNSTFTGITMTDVGEYGRGTAFGGTGVNTGGFGSGIDINLKYGTYNGTIVITDFAFTNVGSSDLNGAGTPHVGGAAISVKGRNDAPSYNTNPANVAGLTVTISNGTIDGTSTGIRLGEPGKVLPGTATPAPENNVTGPNLTVTGVVIDNAQYELDNVSKSVLTVTLDADDDNAYDAGNAATATGSIVFNGNALANTFTGAKGDDVFNGSGGADHLNGGDGNDTFNFASTAAVALATVDGGAGTDSVVITTATGDTLVDLGGLTLTDVERVVVAGGATTLDASDLATGLTLVGNAAANTIIGTTGNDTIQGLGGNDTVKYQLGKGNDRFEGGNGVDSLEIDGKAALAATTYNISAAGAVLTVEVAGSTQTTTEVEKLKIELSGNGDTVTLSGDLAMAGIVGTGSEIRIDAGLGNDVVNAALSHGATLAIDLGAGDDTFIGGRFGQTVKGGAGLKDMFDLSLATGTVNFNLGTGALLGAGIGGIASGNTGFEQVRGSAYNDILNGSSSAAVDETFYASLGNDLINGRTGADTYSGTYIRPDGVTKESIGHALYVNLEDGFATDGTSTVFTHTLVNIENIIGSAYDDVLMGDAGANVIDGEAGNDYLAGGLGNDTYIANSIDDQVVELANEGIDTVFSSRGRTTDLFANVENLTLTGNTAVSAIGNGLDNYITGNGAKNTIDGKAGNDVIEGGGGFDTMTGGLGNDTFVFRNVSDTGIGSGNRDRIMDFVHGQDKIDLGLLSATDFSYRGTSAFLDNEAPQVRYLVQGSQTVVQVDTDGNGAANFEIQLNGGNIGLTADDFLL